VLEVFEIDVLEVLHRLTLYSTIGRPEISKIYKINKTVQQIEDYQQYDAMARYVLSLRNFWHKNHLNGVTVKKI
jgi:hypothetical protein